MTVCPKSMIPMDCPGCGVPVLSDEFYCSECDLERADEAELDNEMKAEGRELPTRLPRRRTLR